MNRYVTDSHHGICLDGIRMVSKDDNTYDTGFRIGITYKGNHFSLKYPTRELRDKTFEQIIQELERRNKRDTNRSTENH